MSDKPMQDQTYTYHVEYDLVRRYSRRIVARSTAEAIVQLRAGIESRYSNASVRGIRIHVSK